MKNGLPQKAGTISGANVSIRPNCRQIRNTGIIVTWPGSITDVPSPTASGAALRA